MLFVGFCIRFLRRTLNLSKHDPNEYAVDLRRSPGASPVRRDPPSLVARELVGNAQTLIPGISFSPYRNPRKPGSVRRRLNRPGGICDRSNLRWPLTKRGELHLALYSQISSA